MPESMTPTTTRRLPTCVTFAAGASQASTTWPRFRRIDVGIRRAARLTAIVEPRQLTKFVSLGVSCVSCGR